MHSSFFIFSAHPGRQVHQVHVSTIGGCIGNSWNNSHRSRNSIFSLHASTIIIRGEILLYKEITESFVICPQELQAETIEEEGVILYKKTNLLLTLEEQTFCMCHSFSPAKSYHHFQKVIAPLDKYWRGYKEISIHRRTFYSCMGVISELASCFGYLADAWHACLWYIEESPQL